MGYLDCVSGAIAASTCGAAVGINGRARKNRAVLTVADQDRLGRLRKILVPSFMSDAPEHSYDAACPTVRLIQRYRVDLVLCTDFTSSQNLGCPRA
jgi:DNA invertase Pin-like site-specific DNA recombinase